MKPWTRTTLERILTCLRDLPKNHQQQELRQSFSINTLSSTCRLWTQNWKDAASERTEVLQQIINTTLDLAIGWIWHLRTYQNEQHCEPVLHSTRIKEVSELGVTKLWTQIRNARLHRVVGMKMWSVDIFSSTSNDLQKWLWKANLHKLWN